MDVINKGGGYTLRGLNNINFILGKNGSGKSTLLKAIEQATRGIDTYGITKYITPERGGHLIYEASVENSIVSNVDWMPSTRRVNQLGNFRQQSLAQYRKLEILVLRELEKTAELRNDENYGFDSVVTEINTLLDNIEIRRHDATFQIYTKQAPQLVRPQDISSGEAELISLAIECLVFEKECKEDLENILFLDSPDVHLHPDLQVRLMVFLKRLVERTPCRIIIATHSTALLGSLLGYEGQVITFMKSRQMELDFKPISSIYRSVLPVFGAHPLSNVFNEAPIFLVEGEDDERIWQKAVKTTGSQVRLYPCSVGGNALFSEFENSVEEIINSVYEDAKAYSLRDRDDGPEDIENLDTITRMKLSCRESENLLLTDDVLGSLNTDWETLQASIHLWIENNGTHPHAEQMRLFSESGDRKKGDVKTIRNDLMGIIGSNKPWEVAIGQVIGQQDFADQTQPAPNSLKDYLGTKLINTLSQHVG